MDAPAQFRNKAPVNDTEDLALLFIEEEVGRFDWLNNWPKYKEKHDVRQRVTDWLAALNTAHDPDEIIAYLDGLVAGRTGRWA